MTDQEKAETNFVIPPEAQEQTKGLIGQGLELFRDHLKQLGKDLAEFSQRRQELRERMQRGARRTSGRIV